MTVFLSWVSCFVCITCFCATLLIFVGSCIQIVMICCKAAEMLNELLMFSLNFLALDNGIDLIYLTDCFRFICENLDPEFNFN